jgi:predicted transcriptional regulator
MRDTNGDREMTTKTADSKGRVTLGQAFANKLIQIHEQADGRLILIPCRAIPEREAWLYENEHALDMVREGLAAAAAGRLVERSDIDEIFAFGESIPGE